MMRAAPRLLAIVLSLAGVFGQVSACGYDGLYSNPLQAAYPGSLSLAVASRSAVERGLIPVLPPQSGSSGLFRSQAWLHALRGRLEAEGLNGSVALLLGDSGLWARFRAQPSAAPAGGSVQLEPHIAGPDESDVVVITTEAALSALLAGRIDITAARAAGVIRYQGAESIPALDKALTSKRKAAAAT